MNWLAAAVASWVLGALVCAAAPGRGATPARVGVAATLIGAACLVAAAVGALTRGAQAWEGFASVPFGPVAFRLDPIAAVFLLPIASIGALAGVYAPSYARLGPGPGGLRAPFAALQLTLASMAVVVAAANTVLLLLAWEVMTLASWVLVSEDHHDGEVRAAGLNYLVAGHVSGAALALLFVLLAGAGGWLVPLAPVVPGAPGLPSATVLFVLALIGFGTKAAVAPLHVWLPDAHAAAPSHVSALMSGVLVTLGFYGLARFAPLLGAPSRGMALTLMGLGALGACGGIVMALSQRDVKRVLAYSTVENAGLITLSIGAALLATAAGQPFVAALAWSAAFLHVWNHAVAKGLLFFAAGALARVVGSRDLESWGGLLRRAPRLATPLIVGAAALVGLPGTHGFASVWLLLTSLFRGAQSIAGPDRIAMLLAVMAVAFTEGAALACFVRIVGTGLLGHPRGPGAAAARDPDGAGILLPLVLPAVACFALVALLVPMLALIGRAVEQLVPEVPFDAVGRIATPLPWLAALPLGAAALVVLWRAISSRTRVVRAAVTWDCGYARPEASMQYTASSLPQPVTRMLEPVLRATVRWRPPAGLWPAEMRWESWTLERALAEVYRPAYARLSEWLGLFRRLQEGRVMVYLRYLGAALLVLLFWLFGPAAVPR